MISKWTLVGFFAFLGGLYALPGAQNSNCLKVCTSALSPVCGYDPKVEKFLKFPSLCFLQVYNCTHNRNIQLANIDNCTNTKTQPDSQLLAKQAVMDSDFQQDSKRNETPHSPVASLNQGSLSEFSILHYGQTTTQPSPQHVEQSPSKVAAQILQQSSSFAPPQSSLRKMNVKNVAPQLPWQKIIQNPKIAAPLLPWLNLNQNANKMGIPLAWRNENLSAKTLGPQVRDESPGTSPESTTSDPEVHTKVYYFQGSNEIVADVDADAKAEASPSAASSSKSSSDFSFLSVNGTIYPSLNKISHKNQFKADWSKIGSVFAKFDFYPIYF